MHLCKSRQTQQIKRGSGCLTATALHQLSCDAAEKKKPAQCGLFLLLGWEWREGLPVGDRANIRINFIAIIVRPNVFFVAIKPNYYLPSFRCNQNIF
jgi:hypothetical protein